MVEVLSDASNNSSSAHLVRVLNIRGKRGLSVDPFSHGCFTHGHDEPTSHSVLEWHLMATNLPALIANETELDDWLTRPSAALVQFIPRFRSPLVILGAGGKMGPTLAVLAKRAADAARHPLEVIAVSRFSDATARSWLEDRGVRTVAADLLDRAAIATLPDSANVAYLVGLKFGTQTNPSRTWAVNTLVPAAIVERYRCSRIVALSTGNVYPLARVEVGGSRETDALTPLGEYANAAVARERIFEHLSLQVGTPITQLRLSYALDLRYGVVADIAGKVWRGEPISLATGHFNGIWQGDANDMILRSFELAASPVAAFNLSSVAIYSVRETARQLGELLGRDPVFEGTESGTAFVSDTARLTSLLGEPPTPLSDVLRWTAEWVKSGARTFNKPAHFEVRDGAY